jgi:hypothetical protein
VLKRRVDTLLSQTKSSLEGVLKKYCERRSRKPQHVGDKIVWNDFEQRQAGPEEASPRDGVGNNRSVQESA